MEATKKSNYIKLFNGISEGYRNKRGGVELERNESDTRYVEGRAIVFDEWTELIPGVREKIDSSVARLGEAWDGDIMCCIDHKPDLMLGRTGAGTMTWEVRKDGVYYRSQIPNTQYGKDFIVNFEMGHVYGSSFRFTPDYENMSFEEDSETGDVLITHSAFRMVKDLSPVYTPAYPQSTSQLRALERNMDEIKKMLLDHERSAYLALARAKHYHTNTELDLKDFIY